jgi:hypothetical protein
MNRPPNVSHSKKLAEICEKYELIDPYRYFNPDLQEFTYAPRSDAMKNRSRIDFFLVSESLLLNINGCKISQGLQNKLFDHKAVTLIVNDRTNTGIVRPAISNKDLNDDLLEFLVKTTVSETYLIHATDHVIKGVNKNFLLNTCGTIRRLIRECGPPIELRVGEIADPDTAARRERMRNRLQVLTGTLNLNNIEHLNLNCDPDIFFKTLLLNIKNDTISHQSFMRKVKHEKVSDLKNNFLI